MDAGAAIIVTIITAATPLVFAALGELITERAGVLNLGVEGMMLVGAVAGFIATVLTGSPYIGILAAILAGILMSLIFGGLTQVLLTNQVATGLALTIFGIGLSAFIGLDYVGTPIDGLRPIAIPGLSAIPVVGPLLFNHDILIYFSIVMFAVVAWFLFRTRGGLILRAVGESHDAAHAIGYSVVKIRFLAIMFGGGMAGLAGAYLSLVYTPQWAENMTAGRGWIALALVVFASWKPARLLVGAIIFGFALRANFTLQAAGISEIPAEFLAMLPYVLTLVVLIVVSSPERRRRTGSPAALGVPYVRDER